jgi:predicted RNA binding protein YcfA (HicA-like mRNA interferase family)
MKLPVASGTDAVKAFRKVGYEFDEQHGSHMILRHTEPPYRRLSIPNHKELAKGTLRAFTVAPSAYSEARSGPQQRGSATMLKQVHELFYRKAGLSDRLHGTMLRAAHREKLFHAASSVSSACFTSNPPPKPPSLPPAAITR